MQILSRWAILAGLAMTMTVAMPALAEAPVYDADSMPQQFEGSSDPSDQTSADQNQDLPPPPPPGQEGAFVPRQAPSTDEDSMGARSSAVDGGSTSSLSPEQRMRRLEQQVSNMQNMNSSARTDALQDQVQALRGQVEQLTHQLQQIQTQQAALVTQLATKMGAEAANAAANRAGSPVLPIKSPATRKVPAKSLAKASADVNSKTASANKDRDGQPNVAEEQQIYQTAYNLIKAKKYDDAVNTLQSMLKKYPSGQFASNAHYWLGELYGLMSKNDQALTEFNTVLKNYPDSPRVSDAQLKLGLIYAAQSKWSDAKGAFKKVINLYPGTASARLAAEHLKQIKQAGN